MEEPMAGEQSALCGTADVWVLGDVLWCVPHVTADTVMNQSALSLQLYLPNLAPHLYYACKMDVLVRS